MPTHALKTHPAAPVLEAPPLAGQTELRPLGDLITTAQAQARSVPAHILASLHYTGVHILSGAEELTELFRLRRRLFQTEGTRNYLGLSRDDSAFVETCDLSSLQVGYFENGALVYALRHQEAATAAVNPNYAAAWTAMRPHLDAGEVLMTRFVNSAKAKRLTGIYNLFFFCYHLALISGVRVSLLTCAPDKTRFFSHIGYRLVETYTCPHSGSQCVMQLHLHDAAHLKAIRSPLHKVWTKVTSADPALVTSQGNWNHDRHSSRNQMDVEIQLR